MTLVAAQQMQVPIEIGNGTQNPLNIIYSQATSEKSKTRVKLPICCAAKRNHHNGDSQHAVTDYKP